MRVRVSSWWEVVCYSQKGDLKWREDIPNVVVTQGLNKLIDATFVSGLTGPTWYVGLVNNVPAPTYAAGDTAASHTGWSEWTSYTGATRPAWTGSAPASGSSSNVASPAVFVINASGVLDGAFLISNSTKGGTSGFLYAVAAFSGGDRTVANNDIITVVATLSAQSA